MKKREMSKFIRVFVYVIFTQIVLVKSPQVVRTIPPVTKFQIQVNCTIKSNTLEMIYRFFNIFINAFII